jgi:glutamine synthetase
MHKKDKDQDAMSGRLDLEALTKLVQSGEIDTVIAALPDMQGRLMGKRVMGHFFLDSVVEETHGCNYLLTTDLEMEAVPGYKAASWDRGYGDFVLKPDMITLRRIPWLEGTALVLCDILDHHSHAEVPHAPRAMLKRQLARLAEHGWIAKMGSELEFYVIDETYEEARAQDYKNLRHAGWYNEDYNILQTSKEEPLIRAIRNAMEGCGIPVEVSKGECGPGQEELNLRYAEALEMADRHVIYKNGAKEIAHLHGKAITFMAKLGYDLPGSSFHLHSSLWDAKSDKPLFADKTDQHGLSALFKHYIAGLLDCLPAMTYFLAPNINSYKRFQAGSFAPTKSAWSLDNRTAGFRVLGPGAATRVECRVPGADANPYLAYAAVLAAGLHGIENKLELGPPFDGNAYAAKRIPDVPKTLRAALKALDKSKVMRAALGDEVVDHYLHAGNWEQLEYDRRVTDWEVIRGFERT